MITSYPAPLGAGDSPRQTATVITNLGPEGSWRYAACRTPRTVLLAAALLSAGVHAGVLFGFRPDKKKVTAVKTHSAPVMRLTIPVLDLEEPEPVPTDDAQKPADTAALVPMQADLPQVSRPSDFVQQINFSSLMEKPDLSALKVTVIPDNYRGGRALAESIGKIFNLADLDRIPEPVLQSRPIYPVGLKRQGTIGTVKVQFVVDTDGRVLDAHVMESTHSGFDDAAVTAVSKWRFRPGVRSGKKVNTRMAVPIVFEFEESEI